MRDRDVIVQLSTFQHNMILSGLPRKFVQPWSYEKDVQMELYSLALAAEMTSLINQTASEGKYAPSCGDPYSLAHPTSQ